MFKKIGTVTLLLMIVCLVSLQVSAKAADIAKIGVVDFKRILETSEAGKQANEQLKTLGSKMESELKKEGMAIEEIQKNLEREAYVMSKDKREEKAREIRIRIGDFRAMEKKYKEELQQKNIEYVKVLKDEVVDLVKEIGKREGYLLVIDNLSVLYAPSKIDLTDMIIKELDAKYSKKKKTQ